MKKAIDSLDLRSKPFLSAFLCILPFFILFRLFAQSHFNVNDDHWVIFFTKGIGLSLQPDAHIYTNNILLGYVLKALYQHMPGPNWYAYLLFGMVFLAFWSFLASLLVSSKDWFKGALYWVVLWFCNFFFCEGLNYTMEGILLAQSGIFLMVQLFQVGTDRFRGKILAMSLCCFALSFLLRVESFFLAGLTAAPFVLYSLWGKKLPLKYVLPFLILGAGIVGGHAWDRSFYQTDPAWKTFNEKILCFRLFYDWRNMEYNATTKPYFDEIGWNENDANLFRNYFFMDKTKYTMENLQKLGKHLPLFSAKGKRGNVSSLRRVIFGTPWSFNILMCFLFFLLFCPVKRIPLLVLNLIWVLFVILFLMYSARAVERVLIPSLAFLPNLALVYALSPRSSGFSEETPAGRLPKKWLVVAGLWMSFLFVVSCDVYWKSQKIWLRDSATFKESIKRLEPKDNQLFVVWGSSIFHEFLNAFDDFNIYNHFHMFIIGSWSISPYGEKMLDHFHVKDVSRDLVDNPNIFLVCAPAEGEMFKRYLLENYNLKIRPEHYYDGYKFDVYRIHSTKGK